MKFYRWDQSRMFFSSKNQYAYLSVNKSNKIPDGYKGPIEEYQRYKCPYCGFEEINLFYPEKHIAVFCKDKVGDVSLGVRSYGAISFSSKILNMITKYGLKGIVGAKKYISMETTKQQPITSIDGDYYAATIKFDPLIWKYIDEEDKCIVDEYTNEGCSKCQGNKCYIDIPKTAKLYLQGLNQETLDIFSTIDNAGEVFFSERFIDACRKENITNLLDKIVEVYDIEDISNS